MRPKRASFFNEALLFFPSGWRTLHLYTPIRNKKRNSVFRHVFQDLDSLRIFRPFRDVRVPKMLVPNSGELYILIVGLTQVDKFDATMAKQ
jgi:hypothetical protein